MLKSFATFGLAILVGLVGQQSVRADLLEYTAGHGDIGVAYEGGALELHYHFETSAVLNGVTLGLGEEVETGPGGAYVRVSDSPLVYNANYAPNLSQYDFTGRTGDDPDLWVLPSSNVEGVPYLGIAAEEGFNEADWNGGIRISLDSWNYIAHGSGDAALANFSLFQVVDPLNPTVTMATSDGVDGNDSFVSSFGHDHFNYGFTEEGIYELTLTATGDHVDFGELSDTGTFRFSVGDGTPAAVPEPGTTGVLVLASSVLGIGYLVRRRRKKHENEETTQG